MATLTESIQRFVPRQAADLALPLGIVGILIVMMIPLPTLLLDFMLALNITIGIIILLVSMNVLRPLDFSLFPTVLLITTLYRLALNVASTRLILLHGGDGTDAAGKVIQAFGNFVVGGNFAVGLIIFVILVIINFVVITKGAGRIAEVSARFTLDAMPGKQMAIDADLNAGLITDAEARARRIEVSREADFYGAMDGASKFVRGDAVAGILITVINIVGGISIGVIQEGMSASDAVTVYSILSIGDGLVAQVPALIISTAAGIIVTRAAAENKLSTEMGIQIFRHPRALASAAGVLGILGLVPGLPHVAFLVLAGVTGGIAYLSQQTAVGREKAEAKAAAVAAAKPAEKEETVEIAPIDALSMEVGYRLIPLVDASAGGELLGRIKAMRKQAANETGFLVPPIHIKDNLQLKPEEYVLLLKGVEVGRGEVMTGSSLAIDPGNAKKGLEGKATKEPAFGLPAMWIQDSMKEKAKLLGYTVVSPAIVIVTHLTELVRSNAHEILTRQDVQNILDGLKSTHPKVVEELVPTLMSVGAVQKVLRNLLKERVPVRDILTIIETLADYAPFIKDTDRLTEFVRQALARTITKLLASPDGTVTVMMLDPRAEEAVSKSVHETPQGTSLALAPSVAEKLLTRISEGMQAMASEGHQPILVVSPEIRRYLRGLSERVLPSLIVLSTSELSGNVKIKNYKVVNIS